MASLACLSSHRRLCIRCGRVALPIVQISASPKGVACPAPPRSTPQSGIHWTWPVDDFHCIAQGHHRDASCKHSRIAHDHPLSRAEPSGPQFVYGDCTARLPQTNPKHCQSLLQKVKIFEPVATWRTRRDSDIADKVMRNDRRRVKIPVGASLKVMLERTPGVATVILTTTNETAWTEGGFRQAGARRARRLAYRTGSLSRTCAAPP
jgi:hypothetical protein